MKMEFAKGNGYKLPVARFQERIPNGGRYVTAKWLGTNLGDLLVHFERKVRADEVEYTDEEKRKYAHDIRVVCGDVVIAEKVWER